MKTERSVLVSICLCLALLLNSSNSSRAQPLQGSEPLTVEGDVATQMVEGISRFMLRETDRAITARTQFWRPDFSSLARYENSILTNRNRLRTIIGAVDPRMVATNFEILAEARVAVTGLSNSFSAHAVRWPVFSGVHGEGLLLKPNLETPRARVIALADADQTPEMVSGLAPGLPPERQFARRLAENGYEVLVPVLLNRDDQFSGSTALKRFTNQPHREWIYRQAYELGRHVIGYEVQKVLAAVDILEAKNTESNLPHPLLAIAGYAEGGLIAFYSAALDPRIKAALISGYFAPRKTLWQEPIYRNVFDLLTEFGDAEIATLIAPRPLVIEHSPVPKIDGPPKPHEGRSGAAPGKVSTPDYAEVESEFERARGLLHAATPKQFDSFTLISGTEGLVTGPMSDRALAALLNGLGLAAAALKSPAAVSTESLSALSSNSLSAVRQEQQIKELEDFTQTIFRRCESNRNAFFWDRLPATSPQAWESDYARFKKSFAEEVIGRFRSPALPLNPRTRKKYDRPKWTGYEVMLDVYPEVFAYGCLLLPNDLKPNERRPVVVCQHGLEGTPADVIAQDLSHPAYHYYKGFAAQLADLGFVVFAPQNPYKGGDNFRRLQRQANPLGKSLFSIIIAQHSQILEWLSQQPFVDPNRIGFYGLSYGGKTAMRVPAVLDKYALSICSGDFNEWVRKNACVDSPISYMFTGEYEMPEFNLGQTFNYAEMAGLIAPRPFMVERGHNDSVGIDEWVAGEYAKVSRLYERLGISDRTRIEFFDGPHTIHGVGTFDFLRQHLAWPPR